MLLAVLPHLCKLTDHHHRMVTLQIHLLLPNLMNPGVLHLHPLQFDRLHQMNDAAIAIVTAARVITAEACMLNDTIVVVYCSTAAFISCWPSVYESSAVFISCHDYSYYCLQCYHLHQVSH